MAAWRVEGSLFHLSSPDVLIARHGRAQHVGLRSALLGAVAVRYTTLPVLVGDGWAGNASRAILPLVLGGG